MNRHTKQGLIFISACILNGLILAVFLKHKEGGSSTEASAIDPIPTLSGSASTMASPSPPSINPSALNEPLTPSSGLNPQDVANAPPRDATADHGASPAANSPPADDDDDDSYLPCFGSWTSGKLGSSQGGSFRPLALRIAVHGGKVRFQPSQALEYSSTYEQFNGGGGSLIGWNDPSSGHYYELLCDIKTAKLTEFDKENGNELEKTSLYSQR